MSTDKKGSRKLGDITQELQERMSSTTTPPTGRPIPAPTQLMRFSADYQRVSEELEALKRDAGKALEIPLDKLTKSQYQLWDIEPGRAQALAENLKQNPLNSPIVVRRSANGDTYEIVAGHHRTEAFKLLGRASIPAVVQSLTDDEADRLVFYDNLLAPDLSDYQKYVWFKKRKTTKNLSNVDLAAEAGVSEAFLTHVFSFDKLSPEALELLGKHSWSITARTLYEVLTVCKSNEPLVTEALGALLSGKLVQSELKQWAAARVNNVQVSPVTKTHSRPLPMRTFIVGNVALGEMRQQRKEVVFKFRNVKLAEKASQLLADFLAEHTSDLADD